MLTKKIFRSVGCEIHNSIWNTQSQTLCDLTSEQIIDVPTHSGFWQYKNIRYRDFTDRRQLASPNATTIFYVVPTTHCTSSNPTQEAKDSFYARRTGISIYVQSMPSSVLLNV